MLCRQWFTSKLPSTISLHSNLAWQSMVASSWCIFAYTFTTWSCEPWKFGRIWSSIRIALLNISVSSNSVHESFLRGSKSSYDEGEEGEEGLASMLQASILCMISSFFRCGSSWRVDSRRILLFWKSFASSFIQLCVFRKWDAIRTTSLPQIWQLI